MTIFKDPENTNYIFYRVLIVLAIVGSLFWGEPAKSQQSMDLKLLHKHIDRQVSTASKPVVCNHPDTIIQLVDKWGEKPKMKLYNVSPNLKGIIIPTNVVFGMNIETGTWSLVEFINADWACIIANGTGAEVIINN